MTHPIRPADRQYRRQFFLSVLVVLLVGCAGLWWCFGYLDRLEALAATDLQAAMAKMKHLFQWLAALGMIDLSSGGAFLLWLGQRTLGSGCYPPPEVPVMRDTHVLEGAPARWRGRALFVVGNLILTGSILGGFALLWWLRSL